MRKTFSKFLATAAAVSMLASVSAVVNADEVFETRAVEGGLVITGITGADEATEITIPETIGDAAVIGVDDYAFAELDNIAVINAPASLKSEFIGNVAFITKKSITNYINAELGEDADEAALVEYVAKQIAYAGKTEGWTEDELAEVKAKIVNKAALAGVADDATPEEAILTMLVNQDAMALSEDTANKLGIWETTITYSGIKVNAPEGSDAAAYVASKEILGMNQADVLYGDANGDGEVNVRDAAAIANALAYKTVDQLKGNGDYNQDGSVTVRDAAAIANMLASASKN